MGPGPSNSPTHLALTGGSSSHPNTITGADADYAWVGGSHKLYEHEGSVATQRRWQIRRILSPVAGASKS